MKSQSSRFAMNAPRLSALSLAIAMALGAPALPAATIAVSSNADPGTSATCTLRQAINAINAAGLPGGTTTGSCSNGGAAFGTSDTINFSGVTSVQLDGANGELDLFLIHPLTINGTGNGGVTVSLKAGSGAFSVIAERGNVFSDLTLTGLTVTGGNASGSGGGVYTGISSTNTLTLNNCVITGNTAARNGGGVYGDYVVLNNTSVANNTAAGTAARGGTSNTSGWGGGLFIWESATIANSTIGANSAAGVGGGIYVCAPTLTDSIITGNSTISGNGGGLNGYGSCGDATLTNSIVSGNSVDAANSYNGGGIWFEGNINLVRSTVSGNTAFLGGGIFSSYAGEGSGGTVTLTDSTVSGNTGTYVSGIYAGHAAVLYNSTISGNTTTVSGNVYSTALFVGQPNGGGGQPGAAPSSTASRVAPWPHGSHASHATLAPHETHHAGRIGNALRPAAGRIQANVYAYSTLTLASSIVSRNSSLYDIAATPSVTASGGHNIIGNVSASVDLGSLTNEVAGNPLLAPLANNGCSTPAGAAGSTACVQTMALQAGSPAINAGSDPLALGTDERGVAFTRVFGAAADIGAFEAQPAQASTAVPVPAISRWALLAVLAQFCLAALYRLRRIRLRRPDS